MNKESVKKEKSGSRTLLMSVLMSSPGPLVVGLGLLVGQSSTQLADFVRRSAELLAIILSYIVYTLTNKQGYTDLEKKARLERMSNLFVGGAMILGGTAMIFITLFSENTEKGNVIPGLSIAVMGVIANSLFWRKYTKLGKETGNQILTVQARLYRAKTFVDGCVTIALTTVAVFPESQAAFYLDFVGSVIVAVYLIYCGIKTIKEIRKNVK